MSGQRFRLEIHPDDAQAWKDMTGRIDDEAGGLVRSQAGLDSLLESAERNGIRVVRWWPVGDDG